MPPQRPTVSRGMHRCHPVRRVPPRSPPPRGRAGTGVAAALPRPSEGRRGWWRRRRKGRPGRHLAERYGARQPAPSGEQGRTPKSRTRNLPCETPRSRTQERLPCETPRSRRQERLPRETPRSRTRGRLPWATPPGSPQRGTLNPRGGPPSRSRTQTLAPGANPFSGHPPGTADGRPPLRSPRQMARPPPPTTAARMLAEAAVGACPRLDGRRCWRAAGPPSAKAARAGQKS